MKAIVIGGGYSLLKNLDVMLKIKKYSDSDDVLIFTSDKMLRLVLANGISPSKIIAVTTEGYVSNIMRPKSIHPNDKSWDLSGQDITRTQEAFYRVTREQAQDIRVHLSCQVPEHLKMYIESRGFQVGRSFHRMNLICQRQIEENAENFREGYNVGVACIWAAARFYAINEIFTIGIDLMSSITQYGYDWQGELENSILGMINLRDQGVKVYNCNPNGEGRFYAPIEKSSLEIHFK